MALDKTLADIATLSTLANEVLAKSQSDQASASQAIADLANADDTVSAQLLPVIAILQQIVPA